MFRNLHLLLLLAVTPLCAQQTRPEDARPTQMEIPRSTLPVPDHLPEAPTPPGRPPVPIQASGGLVAGSFCGAGASTSIVATKPTFGCGAGLTVYPRAGLFFEVGILAPQANRSYVSGYLSLDAKVPLRKATKTFIPVVIGGYSRLFETGHSLDYGVAFAIPRYLRKPDYRPRSYQVELRDYWTFANPAQHNVVLRIGWLLGISD